MCASSLLFCNEDVFYCNSNKLLFPYTAHFIHLPWQKFPAYGIIKSPRDRMKIEYYVPRQLLLSLLRLKDNDHPFRVIDSYIHRHGTFLSEQFCSPVCVSVSMYVRVFFVLPSPWLHKNRKVECRWLHQNSESKQTKGGLDATQEFLYGSQSNLWFRT